MKLNLSSYDYPQEQLRQLAVIFALIEIENEDKGVAVNQATLTPLTIVPLYQIQVYS